MLALKVLKLHDLAYATLAYKLYVCSIRQIKKDSSAEIKAPGTILN